MTFAELKLQLESLTPEQLAADVVCSGNECGGEVLRLWIADEDWIDNDGDCEPRSVISDPEPDAHVLIPKGTPRLLVDEWVDE